MDDPLGRVLDGLRSAGLEATAWNRRAVEGREANPWPPSGPFGAAVYRMPKAKEELHMGLHAAASALRPGGALLVYGANDEGIRSALSLMGGILVDLDTVAVGGRCRIQRGVLPPGPQGIRGHLADWRTESALGYPSVGRSWVSYPGVFSHGRLDGGTRLLLQTLPSLHPGARILDFGCGSGIIGHVAGIRGDGLEVELSDVASVALAAAEENVPGATLRLLDGLPPGGSGPYDAILTNPPFHEGKAEQPASLLNLAREAGRLLVPGGRLVLVTQKRFPVRAVLERHFSEVQTLSEDGVFWVLQARGAAGP